MIERSSLPAICREVRENQRHDDPHVSGCEPCRESIAADKAVASLLGGLGDGGTAPSALTDRLTAIAGAQASQPLWLAGTGSGELPSPRRTRRRRAMAGSVAMMTCVGMLFTLGLLMSPTLPVISDARESASREYDLTLGSGAGAQAVNVVLASAQGGRLSPTSTISSPKLMPSMDWNPVSEERALELLMSSVRPQQSYSGVQRVTLASAAGAHVVAKVSLAQRPGSDIGVSVRDLDGHDITSGVLPAKQPRGQAALPPAAEAYRLGNGGTIAGQSALLLEAKRADRSLVARWWLSPELGLVLWNETFDARGRLVRSAGFTELSLTQSPPELSGLPMQLSAAPATVPSATRKMCTGGFTCDHELAGFRLVQISSDSPDNPTVVHAVYERAGLCITVLQQRGRLAATRGPGYGISEDRTVKTWQSGSVVYTVTTNAAPGVVEPVVAALPHHAPAGEDPVSRSWAGLKRLLGRG